MMRSTRPSAAWVLGALGFAVACAPSRSPEERNATAPAPLVAQSGARIVPPNPLERDSFGLGLAVSGDRLVATSLVPNPSPGPVSLSQAHFFDLVAGTWTHAASFDGLESHGFTDDVDIDGDWAVLGTQGPDFRGQAIIYERVGGTWTSHTTLPNPAAPDQSSFGIGVSLEGDTLAVGAPVEDEGSLLNTGAVYVYRRSGTTWSLEQRLVATTPIDGGRLGSEVALAGDTLAASHSGTSEAIVFTRSGTAWSQEAVLASNETNLNGFGAAIAADGDLVVVGSPHTDLLVGNAGGSHVFERVGTTWSEVAVLRNQNDSNPNFGGAVAIAGTDVASGAFSWGSNNGRLFLHGRVGGAWIEDDAFVEPGPAIENFGQGLALDGTRLAVAGYDDEAGITVGAVFVYDLVDNLADATPCVRDSQCESGSCTEGVCCSAPCDGLCESCLSSLTGAPDGTCSPVTAGTDPESECQDDGAPACTQNGFCDGARACEQYPDPGPDCAPSPCTVDDECTSSHCAIVDGDPSGICCDQACDGDCEGCRAAEHESSPQDGLCQPIRAGTDPKDRCDPAGAACLADGECDGAGACRTVAPEGTSCGQAACSDALATVPECDGAGSCVPAQDNCSPYACGGDSCRTDCATDDDCADSFTCDAGECVGSVTRCSSDGTMLIVPGEPEQSCAPYLCEGGGCLTSCNSTADCASNRVCDTDARTCIAAGGADDEGCGCSVPGRRPPGGILLLLAALALARRRR